MPNSRSRLRTWLLKSKAGLASDPDALASRYGCAPRSDCGDVRNAKDPQSIIESCRRIREARTVMSMARMAFQ